MSKVFVYKFWLFIIYFYKIVMKKFDTIILSGWKWTRMEELSKELSLPKHLFPIGNENITSRLVRQITPFSNKVFCIVNQGQEKLFEHNLPKEVGIIWKELNGAPFISDLKSTITETTNDLIITTWDLVFDDSVLTQLFENTGNNLNTTQIITDIKEIKRNYNFAIRFVILPRKKLIKLCEQETNPENTASILKFLFKNLFFDILTGKFKVRSVETIANLNTPSEYFEARNSLS